MDASEDSESEKLKINKVRKVAAFKFPCRIIIMTPKVLNFPEKRVTKHKRETEITFFSDSLSPVPRLKKAHD